ncbi:unnamed protein product, partial [Ectocarpus sp. 12 AP-2014]
MAFAVCWQSKGRIKERRALRFRLWRRLPALNGRWTSWMRRLCGRRCSVSLR